MAGERVWVVRWELQESEHGEVCGLVGVYADEALAIKAAREEAGDWKVNRYADDVIAIDGDVYYPEAQRGRRAGSWDVWIDIDEVELVVKRAKASSGRRGRAVAIVAGLSCLSGSSAVPDVPKHNAGQPGQAFAEVVGSGLLPGWTVTLDGMPLCETPDVVRAERAIACEWEVE